nr:MAG TPA: hypothetical protein [Caudoviricetes sp.]DAW41802.1 MAG TPA: hypothetical protein [Caudoviricetes sp.]
MSFPPYQCFRTPAVWKHFSIYSSPQVGGSFSVGLRCSCYYSAPKNEFQVLI